MLRRRILGFAVLLLVAAAAAPAQSHYKWSIECDDRGTVFVKHGIPGKKFEIIAVVYPSNIVLRNKNVHWDEGLIAGISAREVKRGYYRYTMYFSIPDEVQRQFVKCWRKLR